MITQKGGGGGSHGHPRTTPSYAPVGQGGGHLLKQEPSLKRGATVLLICGAHRQFLMG